MPGGYLAIWGIVALPVPHPTSCSRCGGSSATHGFPAGFDPFFAEIQEVYDELGEGHPGGWRPLPPHELPDATAELEASGRFEPVSVRRYVWAVRYTAEG